MSRWRHEISQSNTYWKQLTDLPLEQSLVLGGATSLAFGEVISLLNSFLQNNLHKTLDFLIPRPKHPNDKYIVHAVAEELNQLLDQKKPKCIPLIAREKLGVGGIILTTSGIYYLKTGTMHIFSSIPFDDGLEEHDDATTDDKHFQLHALCQLSPHTYQLYNIARDNPPYFFYNIKQKFTMFLFDCLLQMILSDFFTLIHEKTTIEDPVILNLALDLISRITKSNKKEEQQQPSPQSWYTYFFKRGLYVNSGNTKKKQAVKNNNSSEKILTSWATQNKTNILANFKQYINLVDESTKTFCRKKYIGKRSKSIEWEQGASLTHCIWEVKIRGIFKTEIQFYDPEPLKESRGTWKHIAKLRYSFIDKNY